MNGKIHNRHPIYGYALRFLKFNKTFSKSLFMTLFISLLSLSTLIGYIRCVNESKNEMNQNIYGEWQAAFFNIDEKDRKMLESNPFINNEGIMKVYGDIQDKNNNEIGSIGTINSELFKIGRLDLLEGRLPENSDEIVMETSTLSSLGYPYLLNQVVELPIIEYQNPNEILVKKYKLTGILRSYSMNWYHDDKLVSAIVSDYSVPINQDKVNKMHIFITVQEGYEEALDNISLKSANIITNKYIILNDSQKYIMEITVILTMILSISMIYLIFSFYRNKLNKSLNILSNLGSTKFQMLGFLFGLIFYKFICASMFAFIFSILFHIVMSDYFSLPILFVLEQSYLIFNVTVVLVVSIVTILGSLFLIYSSVSYRKRNPTFHLLTFTKKQTKKLTLKKIITRSLILNFKQSITILVVLTSITVLLLLQYSWFEITLFDYNLARRYHKEDYIIKIEKDYGYQDENYNEITNFDIDKINKIYGVDHLNAYESYTTTDLYWNDINDSRYLKEYIKVFGTIRSDIYFIDTERVFEEFIDMVNKGSKNVQNYVNSDQVIIILPSFKRESKDLIFVDYKGVGIFKERTISVGDEISYKIDGVSYKKKIGGIIYQLKDSISYPFKQPFTIVEYKKQDESKYSLLKIYMNENSDYIISDKQMSIISSNYDDGVFINNREKYELLKNKLIFDFYITMTIFIGLGIFAIMLLLNMSIQRVDSDRKRNEYFYNLGVPLRKVKLFYLCEFVVIMSISFFASLLLGHAIIGYFNLKFHTEIFLLIAFCTNLINYSFYFLPIGIKLKQIHYKV